MKAIIYGIGKRYYEFFEDSEFIKRGIDEKGIEITGFSDSNENIWGKEVIFNKKSFYVKGLDEFYKEEIDKFIITTKLYLTEIKEKLIEKGYEAEKIISIDHIYKEYLDRVYSVERFVKKTGIEIGGPTKLFCNIYDKCLVCDNVNFSASTVWAENNTGDFEYGNKVLGRNIIADATDLHLIENEKYDFVLSSNNLEHIANPIKALEEFSRIVKKGGIIIVLAPRKERCFDHNREYTSFDHLLEDYKNNILEDDLTHLPEIIEKHDYSMDPACGGKENFMERAKKNFENRCLHHHVFDEGCLRKAFTYVGLEVIEFSPVSDNWLIIGKKGKM